jgi:hypothetical protein
VIAAALRALLVIGAMLGALAVTGLAEPPRAPAFLRSTAR